MRLISRPRRAGPLLLPGLLALALAACAAPQAPSAAPVLVLGPVSPGNSGNAEPVRAYAPPSAVPTHAPGISAGRLAMVDANRRVVIYDARDLSAPPVYAGPSWQGPSPPKVSSDGRRVTYLTQGYPARRIVVWDVEGAREVPLSGLEHLGVSDPDLSGDGRRLVFAYDANFRHYLGLYDLEAGQLGTFDLPASQSVDAAEPTLSGDGRTLAYVATGKSGDRNVYVVDRVTGKPRTPSALNSSANERDPALSADGSLVLFSSDRNGSFDLYGYDLQADRYVDLSAFNSLDDERLPRFLGLDDAGVSGRSGPDDAPRWLVRPIQAWRSP
jgi:Tol biopolymer transport system component